MNGPNQPPTGSPNPLAEFTYGYDAAGNRRYERREHELSGSNRKGETYAYDAVYRLMNWKEGSLDAGGYLQGTASATKDFITLDGLGNWKSYKNNSATYTNSLNNLNQYTTFNGPAGQQTLDYDFVGNLTNRTVFRGEQQYSYDFANRLVRYLDIYNNMTEYQYDALGRRIAKLQQTLLVTRYFYDGDRLIEERVSSRRLLSPRVGC
jgi:YD repeat-containing protein